MRVLATLCLAPLVVLGASAQAHFPFIVPDQDGASARIVMSETMEPDSDVSIDILASATFWMRDRDGHQTSLSPHKVENWLTIALSGSGTRTVSGFADLGFTKRGDSPAHLLVYHPKTILGDPFDPSTQLGSAVPVELVPVQADGGFKLRLLTRGQPTSVKQLRVVTSDGKETDYATDAQGLTPPFAKRGRYAAWARYWVDEPGRRDGKDYAQVRHYATLVFDYRGGPGSASNAPVSAAPTNPSVYMPLQTPVASFGAVACDGWLYVYGGHTATRHDYSTASVSGKLCRLNLREPSAWEKLAGGPGMQGMNIAAWRGKIYRAGGMAPRNDPGEPSDNHSIGDVACFDPATGAWTDLPPLPRPRSSHDVIVVHDQLMVIGGWWMKGRGNKPEWLDTVDILDLSSAQPAWRSIPQPFQRRALIAASLGDQIIVMGGFDSDDTPQLNVDIYNMATKSWSEGPHVPGKVRNGFAPAACTTGGTVFLSVSTGEMFRLSSDQSGWEPVATTTARLGHRLIPNGSEILVVGGASEANMVDLIESVSIKAQP